MWHVTNHGGELVKCSTHIHKSFTECIEDAGSHGKIELLSEGEDISKTTWAWHISTHSGSLIKSSAKLHLSYTECVEDLRLNGHHHKH
jgi:metal-responsive CopG/Arc/MetJ family transcriptional regulator